MAGVARSFFEIYANEYDFLTNAEQREQYHAKEVASLIKQFKPNQVLDAGCASGLTSYLFAKEGIKTVGVDRSRPMLKVANDKYYQYSDLLSFKYGNFEKLPRQMHGKFDLIVCLANSISGAGSMNNLIKSLTNFNQCLSKDGSLVLQLLNYYSIKDGEFLPVKATRNGDIYYQRFSERRGKRLYIYVNRLDVSQEPLKYEMFRHEFENFDVKEILSALKSAGFSSPKKYADLYLEKPFTPSCRDLVIVAKK